MILFPNKTDSSIQKFPLVNYILTSLILAASILFYFGGLTEFLIESIMVPGITPVKAFGSILIQPDLVSIIFITLFVYLLGNALNSVAGNLYYLLFIAASALLSSIVQFLTSSIPPIGANGILASISGGIMAILPANRLLVYRPDLEEETGINLSWLVFLSIAFSVYALLTYLSIINLLTHIACFAGGAIISYMMIKLKLVKNTDATLPEWLQDNISFLTASEFFASILPTRKFQPADDEIKKKAERLLSALVIPSLPEETVPETEPARAPAETPKQEIEINFRLLKPVAQKDHITLYFVYEGPEITGIAASGDYNKCEIYPSEKLSRGDSGSFKLFLRNPEKIETLDFYISYKMKEETGITELTYSKNNGTLICK